MTENGEICTAPRERHWVASTFIHHLRIASRIHRVDPDSLLRRVVLPALEVCEICSKPESEHGRTTHKYERNKVLPDWRGWHAFRRGLATNLNRSGVDDSVIQRILRHSNIAVTQACYQDDERGRESRDAKAGDCAK